MRLIDRKTYTARRAILRKSVDVLSGWRYTQIMQTITIPTTEYRILKERATLYTGFLRKAIRNKYEIEDYTPERIAEFMREDAISPTLLAKVRKMLKAH